MSDVIARFLKDQHSRPLSIAVAVGALFCPASLIILIERPGLFFGVPLPTLLLISASLSLPIIVLCYSIFYSPLKAMLDAERKAGGVEDEEDLVRLLNQDDPLEWPCLLGGAWLAMIAMFVVAVRAYYAPIRIGRSFVMLAGVLGAIWFIAMLFGLLVRWAMLHEAKERTAAGSADSAGEAG